MDPSPQPSSSSDLSPLQPLPSPPNQPSPFPSLPSPTPLNPSYSLPLPSLSPLKPILSQSLSLSNPSPLAILDLTENDSTSTTEIATIVATPTTMIMTTEVIPTLTNGLTSTSAEDNGAMIEVSPTDVESTSSTSSPTISQEDPSSSLLPTTAVSPVSSTSVNVATSHDPTTPLASPTPISLTTDDPFTSSDDPTSSVHSTTPEPIPTTPLDSPTTLPVSQTAPPPSPTTPLAESTARLESPTVSQLSSTTIPMISSTGDSAILTQPTVSTTQFEMSTTPTEATVIATTPLVIPVISSDFISVSTQTDVWVTVVDGTIIPLPSGVMPPDLRDGLSGASGGAQHDVKSPIPQSGGVIAGIFVGVLTILTLFVVAFILILRYQNRQIQKRRLQNSSANFLGHVERNYTHLYSARAPKEPESRGSTRGSLSCAPVTTRGGHKASAILDGNCHIVVTPMMTEHPANHTQHPMQHSNYSDLSLSGPMVSGNNARHLLSREYSGIDSVSGCDEYHDAMSDGRDTASSVGWDVGEGEASGRISNLILESTNPMGSRSCLGDASLARLGSGGGRRSSSITHTNIGL